MIKGLISPILSPFNDDLSFNEDLYVSLAKDLLEKGSLRRDRDLNKLSPKMFQILANKSH